MSVSFKQSQKTFVNTNFWHNIHKAFLLVVMFWHRTLFQDTLYKLSQTQTFADEAIRDFFLFSEHKLSWMRSSSFFRVHKLSRRANFEIFRVYKLSRIGSLLTIPQRVIILFLAIKNWKNTTNLMSNN